MKKRILHIVSSAALCAALAVLMLPVGALAQSRNYPNWYEQNRYEQNRYGQNRYEQNRDRDRYRYEGRYNKSQVGQVIARVEQSSNRFRWDLDAALDRSRLDGTRREDYINEDVRRFEQSLNTLRYEFDRRDSWWETRSNVEAALNAARPVATRMRNNRFYSRYNRGVVAQWASLRRDLNILAARYHLPAVY